MYFNHISIYSSTYKVTLDYLNHDLYVCTIALTFFLLCFVFYCCGLSAVFSKLMMMMMMRALQGQAAGCIMWTIKHCLIRLHGAQPPQRRDRYQQTLGAEMQSTRSTTPLAFTASRHAHCPGHVPAGSPVMLNSTPGAPAGPVPVQASSPWA